MTIALANGKTEQWVTDRTGHKSSAMLAMYTRQARTWAEIGMGTLGALDLLLPEVTAAPLLGHAVRIKGGGRGGGPGPLPQKSTGGVAEWSKAAVLKWELPFPRVLLQRPLETLENKPLTRPVRVLGTAERTLRTPS